jgi:RimJ/RimL family protein N-acetyltransferase
MFKLEGKICYLLAFEERHLNDEKYFSWLRDYDVVKTIYRIEYLRPVSFAEVKEYCETVMRSTDDIFLALYDKTDNLFVGTLRAKVNWYLSIADIGILIGNRQYWGKGLATEAIWLLGRFLFDKLGMRRLTAGLMSVNPGMLRVFEKLGFQREGVFRGQDRFEGEYTDHIYLGCFKDEFRAPVPKV